MFLPPGEVPGILSLPPSLGLSSSTRSKQSPHSFFFLCYDEQNSPLGSCLSTQCIPCTVLGAQYPSGRNDNDMRSN